MDEETFYQLIGRQAASLFNLQRQNAALRQQVADLQQQLAARVEEDRAPERE